MRMVGGFGRKLNEVGGFGGGGGMREGWLR